VQAHDDLREKANFLAGAGYPGGRWFRAADLTTAYLDITNYSVRMILAVVGYVAGNDYSGDFLIFVLVASGIFRVLLVDALIIIQIDGSAFDDDVAAICHGSFSL
jgi:hypothetical protein